MHSVHSRSHADAFRALKVTCWCIPCTPLDCMRQSNVLVNFCLFYPGKMHTHLLLYVCCNWFSSYSLVFWLVVCTGVLPIRAHLEHHRVEGAQWPCGAARLDGQTRLQRYHPLLAGYSHPVYAAEYIRPLGDYWRISVLLSAPTSERQQDHESKPHRYGVWRSLSSPLTNYTVAILPQFQSQRHFLPGWTDGHPTGYRLQSRAACTPGCGRANGIEHFQLDGGVAQNHDAELEIKPTRAIRHR